MPPSDRWTTRDILEDASQPGYPELAVHHGMTLTHTGSNTTGTVSGFSQGDRVVLIDRFGIRQSFRAFDGAFVHEGVRVALREPAKPPPQPRPRTASGSVDVRRENARVARAGRIWVEGFHDAELIEKIWGDDLRYTGVVVEPLHGADDLAAAVTGFAPGPKRRLGILLDHLVDGSKESRLAAAVASPHVLVCGHPFVDVWAAVSPSTIGLDAWPAVPPGRPWKQGVVEALGVRIEPGAFWGRIVDSVTSYRDLETPLVNAVEQLIDFVTGDDHD